jgi:hypothetical protein
MLTNQILLSAGGDRRQGRGDSLAYFVYNKPFMWSRRVKLTKW